MARTSFVRRTPVAASVLTLALAAAVATLTGCGSSGSSSAGGSGKSLSEASITFGAGYNQADSSLIYIAQQNGYFKKQGLTVKIVNTAPLSTSDTVAAFFGGTYDFLNNAAATDILADVSSGGDEMTAIWQSTVGSHEQIAVNNAFAKQIGLTAGSATAASALTEFKKLKNSHITIGVSSLTSLAYIDLVAACKTNGLTCVANSKTADVDIVTAGTPASQVAGIRAGKFDGVVAGPPTTSQPNTTVIQLGLVNPVDESVNDYVTVKPSFAKAHPDTVQAVVNALMESLQYAEQNPSAAEHIMAGMFNAEGVTSAALQQSQFTNAAERWVHPAPASSAYDTTVKSLNLAQAKPVSLPFSQFINASYAQQAAKAIGVSI
jgi:ABC-type nitrate/sulfonate/bicarbonate transport system substrate-binding protein